MATLARVVAFTRQAHGRWESWSSLRRKLVVCLTLLACCLFGFQGLVVPGVFLALTASVCLDPETVKFYKSVLNRYNVELSDTEPDDFIVDGTACVTKRTAVRFAQMAQGRVGMLKPCGANRLVYETTLLRLFDEYNVRRNIRVELLGEALVACFIRPKEYMRALEIIEYLERTPSAEGIR